MQSVIAIERYSKERLLVISICHNCSLYFVGGHWVALVLGRKRNRVGRFFWEMGFGGGDFVGVRRVRNVKGWVCKVLDAIVLVC